MSEFAGSLTQRIDLWERSQVRLETGASSEEMSQVLSCLAAIVAEGAGAADEAMSVSAMPRYRVTVRKQLDFTIDQQVRWRGRRLVVQPSLRVSRKTYLAGELASVPLLEIREA